MMVKRFCSVWVLFAWGALGLGLGCTGESVDLLIDVKTDLVVGAEFVAVRAELFDRIPSKDELARGTAVRERRVEAGAAYEQGRRAAHYEGLAPGKHVLRVRLIGVNNGIVLERVAIFSLQRSSIFTLVMTRSCQNRTCPGPGDAQDATACVGGVCVQPACTPETPEACADFSCDVGTSCVVSAPCGLARCTDEGICLRLGIFGRCPEGQWCHPERGCEPLPVSADDGGVAADGGESMADSGGTMPDASSVADAGTDGGSPEAPASVTLASALIYDGSGWETPGSVAVDGTGSVYFSGSFNSPTIDFGGEPIANQGDVDIFLASLDSTGTHRWSTGFGSAGREDSAALGVSQQGALYMTGTFSDTLSLGGGPLMTQGSIDLFTSRFDQMGNHVWSKGFGTIRSDLISGVAVDGQGNFFSTGQDPQVDFGGGAPGGKIIEGYVVGFDGNGAHRISFALAGTRDIAGRDVAVGADGHIYVTGLFRDAFDFGSGQVSTQGSDDGFVASFDSSGAPRWSMGFGSPGLDWGQRCEIGSDGNLYVGGVFEFGMTFESTPLGNGGSRDGFVASFDENGVHRWSRGLGATGDDRVRDIAVDRWSNVYAVGSYLGRPNFGGGQLPSFGGTDLFVASFDSQGAHRWSFGYGSAGFDHASAVAVSSDGTVYVGAHLADTIDFGMGPVSVSGTAGVALLVFEPAQ